jgi:hypothetical protein
MMLDDLDRDSDLLDGLEGFEGLTGCGQSGVGHGPAGRTVHRAPLRDGAVLIVGASADLRDRLLEEGAVRIGASLRVPAGAPGVALSGVGCVNCAAGSCPVASKAARRLGLPLAQRAPVGFSRPGSRRTHGQRT